MPLSSILPFLQKFGAFAPQNVTTMDSANQIPSTDTTRTPDLNPQVGQNISQMYQPSTAASSAYLDAAKSMPDISSFQPSRLQRIGAFLAGLGTGRPAGMWGGQPVGYIGNPSLAQKTTENALLAPYDIAVENTQNKLKPLEAAANLEMEQNNQERMAAALGNTIRHQGVTENQTQQRLDLTGQANQIRSKYYQDRGSKIETDKDGNSVLLFSDGTTAPLNGIMSPFEVKTMETQKQMDLQLRNEIAVATKNKQMDLANRLTEMATQLENSMGLETQRSSDQIKLKQTPGAGSESTSTETVTDKNGNPLGTKTTTTKKNPIKTNQPKTGGPITMTGPDGKTYAINPENVSKALANGYRIVGGK